MVEWKDQTKRSLSKRAGLACSRQGGYLVLCLLFRFSFNKQVLLCVSLKLDIS